MNPEFKIRSEDGLQSLSVLDKFLLIVTLPARVGWWFTMPLTAFSPPDDEDEVDITPDIMKSSSAFYLQDGRAVVEDLVPLTDYTHENTSPVNKLIMSSHSEKSGSTQASSSSPIFPKQSSADVIVTLPSRPVRTLALLSPIFVGCLTWCAIGQSMTQLWWPFPTVGLIVSCTFFFLLSPVIMPRSIVIQMWHKLDIFFNIMTFAASVMWMKLFASALLFALEFIADRLGIPSSLLSISLLAFGNSVGDLAANLAVANMGKTDMAMAATFAAPVMSATVGVGVTTITSLLDGKGTAWSVPILASMDTPMIIIGVALCLVLIFYLFVSLRWGSLTVKSAKAILVVYTLAIIAATGAGVANIYSK
eukprot:GDKJ01020363.1.p1 GENE.GDKJ01020363.1~~GDKJ01020363.1.p1  ORF type:complete len:402 (-),score=104.14 GDKJ01020363.1:283-1371(-)